MSSSTNAKLVFAKEKSAIRETKQNTWKIMLVDDEVEIHRVSLLAMSHITFLGKKLEFLHAYSGQEARDLIKQHPDVALIFLDVVMEQDDSGLTVVKYIREELKNHFVRIILRTGQPGLAPICDVIVNYDINDYKEKGELTSEKLFATVISSLRGYLDILRIDKNREGLSKLIDSSNKLFQSRSIEGFINNLMEQSQSLTGFGQKNTKIKSSAFFCQALNGTKSLAIISATGKYKDYQQKPIEEVVDKATKERIEQVWNSKNNYFSENENILYLKYYNKQSILYIYKSDHSPEVWELERHLMMLLSSEASIAAENVHLNEEITDTQKEIIYMLGTIAEFRSKETANHVVRVSLYSRLLARHYGLSDKECELIYLASPMHDIGKIGIPDDILNKPGKLSDEEFQIMKTHTSIGYKILSSSNRELFKTASIITHQHHEKWNGSGYPNKLKGENIHIYGRITAVADVFDALGSQRCYKKAWPLEKILDLFNNEKGKHFEPKLVDILFKNLDEFLAIRDKYLDE